jgi:Na+-transporting methylmalonyl-CoA/oxaloacetate decarboxylase beta subunit
MKKEEQKMRKKFLYLGITIITTISGALVLYNLAIRYLVPIYLEYKYEVFTKDASSVGIIGGADGPTFIYLTNFKQQESTPLFLLLFILGLMCLFLMRRKENVKVK